MSLLSRFTRRPVHVRRTSTGKALSPKPAALVPPSIDWPNYKAPWPSYMLKDRESKRDLINQTKKYNWFHGIDLGCGDATSGPPHAQLEHIHRAFLDIDFTGKTVLDTGCWDGLWSFEAEKRGAAEVYSTDLVSQRNGDVSSYQLVHNILNSRARYFPNVSVYDVHTLPKTDFDIVFYLGIFYHVKDPLLALARLRQVTKVGGEIVVEGEVINSDRSFAEFYYRQDYARSSSNWWIPSIPCLREWVECNFFEILDVYVEKSGDEAYWEKREGYGRCTIRARALPLPMQNRDDLKNFYSRYDFLEPA